MFGKARVRENCLSQKAKQAYIDRAMGPYSSCDYQASIPAPNDEPQSFSLEL